MTHQLYRHRKFLFLSLIALVAVSAEEFVELECEYLAAESGQYVCILEGVEVRSRETHVNFTGEHLPGYTEEDVVAVAVILSDMRFIVPEIYTTFPNIIELDFAFAGLQEIDPLPELPNLMAFICFGNDISVIQSNTFANTRSLILLDLELNNINVVEPDAFEGLNDVLVLAMMFNNFTTNLPDQLLWPLTSAIIIDLGDNGIQVIGEGFFERNTELVALGLGLNNIDRIAPTFFGPLSQNLILADFTGNVCVGREFEITDDAVVSFLHASLRQCYNNFLGVRKNETNSVFFEYTGSLRLFDDFGNMILAAN